jgi:hypothetical protein
VLKLLRIQSLRKIGLILMKFRNATKKRVCGLEIKNVITSFLDIKPNILKLWIFNNLKNVLPRRSINF